MKKLASFSLLGMVKVRKVSSSEPPFRLANILSTRLSKANTSWDSLIITACLAASCLVV